MFRNMDSMRFPIRSKKVLSYGMLIRFRVYYIIHAIFHILPPKTGFHLTVQEARNLTCRFCQEIGRL